MNGKVSGNKSRRFLVFDCMPGDLNQVTVDVTQATDRALRMFESAPGTEKILDTFWCLQDRVYRLLDHLHDHPSDLYRLEDRNPNVIPSVVGVLSRAGRLLPFSKIAAVEQACASINGFLLEIQSLKDQRDYGATAKIAHHRDPFDVREKR